MKVAFIDFEYKPLLSHCKLVCCVIKLKKTVEKYWLYEQETASLRARILELHDKGYVFSAYAADAECDCFIELGLNPLDFRWLCLRVMGMPWVHSSSEFARFITQKSGFQEAGKEFVLDKKGRETARLKSYVNLTGALEFFSGIRRNYEEKRDMVKLILSETNYNEEQKFKILDYCEEDVHDLPELLLAIVLKTEGLYLRCGNKASYLEACMEQSAFCAATALYRRTGLPLDMKLYHKLAENTEAILDAQRDLANLHAPFFVEEFSSLTAQKVFALEKEGLKEEADRLRAKIKTCTQKRKLSYSNISKYVEERGLKGNWPLTETGALKKDEETLRMYEADEGISSLLKSIRTTASLNAISAGNFLDYVDEKRSTQHPYFNIFGSVTSRNTPSAKSFLLARASWLRALLCPPEGFSIISADFSAQEVWIAACLSDDKNLMAAYISGDVHLAFGKQAGFIPSNATKESAGTQRDLAKAINLGLQFGMGYRSLAIRTNLKEERAKDLCMLHQKVYSQYYRWKKRFVDTHEKTRVSALTDGYLLLDNRAAKNTEKYREGEHFSLTTANFPIQGTGAVIMRRSIISCLLNKLNVVCPLHDEIIILSRNEEVVRDKALLEECMVSASKSVFPNHPQIKVSVSVQNDKIVAVKDKAFETLKAFSKYLDLELKPEEKIFFRKS